jgi:hypothetical protein
MFGKKKDPIELLLEADARGETTPEQHAAVVNYYRALAAVLEELV